MVLSKEQLLLDLYKAFYDAKRHKSNKKYVKEFESNLHENLISLEMNYLIELISMIILLLLLLVYLDSEKFSQQCFVIE